MTNGIVFNSTRFYKILKSDLITNRYDIAIPIAKQAMDGRKRLLGIHHSTARSIYFVGSLNLVNKKYKEARKYLDEALVMEEELWKKGMDHSIDWPRLKKKIVQLLTILSKDNLAAYKRRFRVRPNNSSIIFNIYLFR